MRKYQPIWEQIKKEGTATVRVGVPMHARIIKAVRKEKDMDYGFKLLKAEEYKKFKLMDSIEGDLITFYLEETEVVSIFNL